jgi:hypothetical protein
MKDHPIFDRLELGGEGWNGSVQIPFFSKFDDIATALYTEKFGGYNYNRASNQDFKQGRFYLWVENADVEASEPTPAQVQAFLRFLADQQLICTTIVDAIFGYHGPHRERWRTGDTILDDITVPPVQSPDDLKRLIRLQHLSVLDMSTDECSLSAFNFACSWDIDHGLGVLIHGANVVEVADSDITRIGPSADW